LGQTERGVTFAGRSECVQEPGEKEKKKTIFLSQIHCVFAGAK